MASHVATSAAVALVARRFTSQHLRDARLLSRSVCLPAPLAMLTHSNPLHPDYFEGLGIFLDTYANSRHSYSFPRISAMMGDGRTSYDHHTDGANHEFAGCSVRLVEMARVGKPRLTIFVFFYLLLFIR